MAGAHRLTPKMLAALGHYARHSSKFEAYKHAYDCENMDDETTRVRAWELFEHPLVKQATEQIKAAALSAVVVDATWLLKRLFLIANFNIRKFIVTRENGTAVYDFREATDDDWYCISEYTVDVITKGRGPDAYEVDRVKLKTEARQTALKMIGEYSTVNAFQKNVSVTGAIAMTQLNADEFKQARREMIADDDC